MRLMISSLLDTTIQKLYQELHEYNNRKKGGEAELPILFII